MNLPSMENLPQPARHAADAGQRYQAFLKAEAILSCVPPRQQVCRPERLLTDLVAHLLADGARHAASLRASSPEAVTTAWLARVRSMAQWFVAANEVPAFRRLMPADLRHVAALCGEPARLSEAATRLLSRGVVLVHERTFPGMKVDGAAFMLASGHPVVALGLRDGRLDHYWQTLMHELAHVVLHQERLPATLIDDIDMPAHEKIELEADALAQDSLLAPDDWQAWPQRTGPSERDVIQFAARVGVAPAIVAGRVRRELSRPELFLELVHRLDVRRLLGVA